MVEVLTGTFGIFLVVILALYAGELVWSERDVKIAGIYDATPISTVVTYTAKLTALCGVVAILQLVLMLAGIIMQAARGYYRFEIPVYLQSLLVVQYVDLVLMAVLAFTVHVVVDNKYFGHFLVILLVIGSSIQKYIGLEHNLWDYTSDGGMTYSDMNGWGPYLHSWLWWKAYWLAFATLLLVLVHLFWVRGAETEPEWRLAIAKRRLSGRTARVAGTSAVVTAALGGFIFYNTNILNTWRGQKAERDLRISYEQRYRKYERMAQPRITRVSIDLDLFPRRGEFAARGFYQLHNIETTPIDTVILIVPEELTIGRLAFAGGATRVLEDRPRNFAMYRLARPLAPGDSIRLDFDLALEERGFGNNVENTQVVSNGTFLSNFAFLPIIGYAPAMEVSDDDARKRAHLPEKDRMPPPTDARALHRNYVSADADFIRLDATVSTDGNQLPVTSGRVDSAYTKDGRAYRHFTLDVPSVDLYAFLSGAYAVKKDEWKSPAGDSVALEIDYYPGHAYNIDRMLESVKASLDYYTREFAPYQHPLLRIVEFPRYASFAQSLPNTIPYSEAIGFIARLEDPKDIDYPYYVTAHEVAHQWWAHQVVGADAQGATMLSETLAQYSAMMVMEKHFGRENMRRFLEFELDRYLLGRSAERKREMPLDLVENQQYIHYNKGSVAMYALRDYIGEEKVNAALRGFLAAHRFKGPPYPTALELVDSLRAVTPDSLRYLVHDLFETITLYELKTDSIVVNDTTGNRFKVEIFGSAKKLRADSVGVETELPMSDWIEIGLFRNADKKDTLADKNGIPVYLQKQRLASGAQHLVIVTSERPIRGGIDPLHKLIDRKVDDNTTGVFDRSKSRMTRLSVPAKRR
jgi:hypothetical protein